MQKAGRMQITLIHNPGAGDDRGLDGAELQRLVQAQGHGVHYRSSRDDGWQDALEQAADLVVVAGGDGTVGRVARSLVGRERPFTVLPMGTANNISKTLGLTDAPLPQLIEGWEQGQAVAFDVGVARGPWGAEYFIEGFGLGLFACTLPAADESSTLAGLQGSEARVAYALQLLRDRLDECPCQAVRATLDGQDLSGEYLLLEAMNMQYVGPNLYFAPECDLQDGMLDILLVPRDRREIFRDVLAAWQNGSRQVVNLPPCRGRQLRLEWTGFDVHLDDRVWPGAEEERPASPSAIEVGTLRGALQFLLPAA